MVFKGFLGTLSILDPITHLSPCSARSAPARPPPRCAAAPRAAAGRRSVTPRPGGPEQTKGGERWASGAKEALGLRFGEEEVFLC